MRDLASVAEVATQNAWAARAGLLVEINAACDAARAAGPKALVPTRQRAFRSRHDALVGEGLAANPDPASGRKRTSLQRQSFNLVTAFGHHRQAILRYMYDLRSASHATKPRCDLRPMKIHRKLSSCFRSQAGAERFALTRLFNGDPWMPPQAA